MLRKIVTETTTYPQFEICGTNDDKGYIRNIHIKCTIIIIFQYTISENVPFIVQSHGNCDEINIDHLPLQY